MSELNKYLAENKSEHSEWMSKRMELNSGLTLSVQASNTHYCEPRKDLSDKSIYTHFEIGFPSEEIELLNGFAEGEDLTETVYPYVPREVIETVISDNGGIKGPYIKGE